MHGQSRSCYPGLAWPHWWAARVLQGEHGVQCHRISCSIKGAIRLNLKLSEHRRAISQCFLGDGLGTGKSFHFQEEEGKAFSGHFSKTDPLGMIFSRTGCWGWWAQPLEGNGAYLCIFRYLGFKTPCRCGSGMNGSTPCCQTYALTMPGQ